MTEAKSFTFNWPFLGNKHIITFLQQSIAAGKFAHCYVFSGPRDIGKGTAARHVAAALLCDNYARAHGALPCGACSSCGQVQRQTHADVRWLRREEGKKNIAVEQVREFIRMMGMGTFGGTYKLGIIAEAETLSNEAANALLKTLEEPSGQAVMILLTEQAERLPHTILSRAQVLRFLPAATGDIYDHLVDEYKANRDTARRLARLCLGRPALAVKLWENKDFFRQVEHITAALPRLVQGRHHERLQAIAEALRADNGDAAADHALNILAWWQVALRDILLHRAQLADIATGTAGAVEAAQTMDTGRLLAVNNALERAGEYIRANVAPKTALEMVALQ